jgi:site-specific DNA-methyltransferase (adenine-specific)
MTACKWDVRIPFEPLWEAYKRIIKDNGAIVLTASQPFTSMLVMSNLEMFKYELIWDRIVPSNFFFAHKMPMKCHQNILIFYDKLPTYNAQKIELKNPVSLQKTGAKGFRHSEHYGTIKAVNDNGDIYKFPRSVVVLKQNNENNQFVQGKNLHPTQKPVALFEYLIRTYTNEGELVLDNCIGSGTTAIASINLKRHFIGIEKDETYCEISNKRVSDAIYARDSQPELF